MTEANQVPMELLRRAADGDQDALAELLTPHRSRLKRMVTIRLNQRLQELPFPEPMALAS